MQIKTTMRSHLTPVRMAIIKLQEITSVGEDVEKREPNTVGGNVSWCSRYGKQYMEAPQKIKNITTKQSRNFTSEYLSEENKNTNWKRFMQPHIHCSTIYNNQDLETT